MRMVQISRQLTDFMMLLLDWTRCHLMKNEYQWFQDLFWKIYLLDTRLNLVKLWTIWKTCTSHKIAYWFSFWDLLFWYSFDVITWILIVTYIRIFLWYLNSSMDWYFELCWYKSYNCKEKSENFGNENIFKSIGDRQIFCRVCCINQDVIWLKINSNDTKTWYDVYICSQYVWGLLTWFISMPYAPKEITYGFSQWNLWFCCNKDGAIVIQYDKNMNH